MPGVRLFANSLFFLGAVAVVLTLLSRPANASSCLLPLQMPTAKAGSVVQYRVHPTTIGVLLVGPDGLYWLDDKKKFKKVDNSKKFSNLQEVFDTPLGVFVPGRIGEGGLYRYSVAEDQVEPKFENPVSGTVGTHYFKLHSVDNFGFYAFSKKRILVFKGARPTDIKIKGGGVVLQPRLIYTGRSPLVQMNDGWLYRLKGEHLLRVGRKAFPFLGTQALSVDSGIIVESLGRLYFIDEEGDYKEILGLPENQSVRHLYAFSTVVLAGTSAGLFALEDKTQFKPVLGPSGPIAEVHSIHSLGDRFVALSSNGIYFFDESLKLSPANTARENVALGPGWETSIGVFFRNSVSRIVFLSEAGDTHTTDYHNGLEGSVRAIGQVNGRIFSRTSQALYSFQGDEKTWVKIPSPALREVEAVKPSREEDGTVYIEARTGVYRWIESALEDVTVEFSDLSASGHDISSQNRLEINWKLNGLPCEKGPNDIEFVGRLLGPGGNTGAEFDVEANEGLIVIEAPDYARKYPWTAVLESSQYGAPGTYRFGVFASDWNNSERLIGAIDIEARWSFFQYSWERLNDFVSGLPLYGWIVLITIVSTLVGLLIHFKLLHAFKRLVFILRIARGDSRLSNQIFISYRRHDAGGHAQSLYDKLCDSLHREVVYFDQMSKDPGIDVADRLVKAVDNCTVLLALIGHDWRASLEGREPYSLDDSKDLVRLEVSRALSSNKRVVPVLIHGAKIPAKSDLPNELGGLSSRESVELRKDGYSADQNSLVEFLADLLNIPQCKQRRASRLQRFRWFMLWQSSD